MESDDRVWTHRCRGERVRRDVARALGGYMVRGASQPAGAAAHSAHVTRAALKRRLYSSTAALTELGYSRNSWCTARHTAVQLYTAVL